MKKILGTILGLTLFCIALYVLMREIQRYGWSDIVQNLRNIDSAHLAVSMMFSTLCYLALTGYDTLAWKHFGHRLAYLRIAKASFVGYAFSHNLGFSLLTGAPVKYRIYSAWGIRAVDVAKVVAFTGFSLAIGFSTLMGLALILEPQTIATQLKLPVAGARPYGMLLVAAVATYLALSAFIKKPIRIKKLHISIPAPHIRAGQVIVSCSEWMFAAATLYVLFVPGLSIPYTAFLAIFISAYVAGFISQVPGGLGVFDTIVLISLKPIAPLPTIMAALLAYRVVYYIIPLICALALLGVHELFHRKNRPASA